MVFSVRLATLGVAALASLVMIAPAQAGEKVNLSLVSATITKSFMPGLIATYTKSHPDISVTVTYAGAKTVSDIIGRGGLDVVIMTESFAQKMDSVLDSPTEAFGMHTAIVAGKSSKIKDPKDLAKSGVQLGGGTAGSQSEKFQNETAQKLAQKYGGDFFKQYLANIALKKPETPSLLTLIEAGTLDGAIVVSAEIDKSKFNVISLPASESYAFYLDSASVKASPHQNEAKAFAAFLVSADAKSAYRAAGYDTK